MRHKDDAPPSCAPAPPFGAPLLLLSAECGEAPRGSPGFGAGVLAPSARGPAPPLTPTAAPLWRAPAAGSVCARHSSASAPLLLRSSVRLQQRPLGVASQLDAVSRGNPCSCCWREQTTAAPHSVANLAGGVVLASCSMLQTPWLGLQCMFWEGLSESSATTAPVGVVYLFEGVAVVQERLSAWPGGASEHCGAPRLHPR